MERCLECIQREAATGDFDDCSDHAPHLVLEEGVGGEGERIGLGGCVELGAVERADGGALLVGGGEGGEVAAAGKSAERGAGEVEGEGRENAPGAGFFERSALGGDEQLVAVLALGRVAARVEVVGDGLDVLHGDAFGEEVVESAQPAALGQLAGGLEGGDLSEGVDAGVGASGEGDLSGLAGELNDSLLERALDGGQVGLPLGAGEGCAVVVQEEGESAGRLAGWGHGVEARYSAAALSASASGAGSGAARSTSSMWAMAAPSPRRGPNLMMRV